MGARPSSGTYWLSCGASGKRGNGSSRVLGDCASSKVILKCGLVSMQPRVHGGWW